MKMEISLTFEVISLLSLYLKCKNKSALGTFLCALKNVCKA